MMKKEIYHNASSFGTASDCALSDLKINLEKIIHQINTLPSFTRQSQLNSSYQHLKTNLLDNNHSNFLKTLNCFKQDLCKLKKYCDIKAQKLLELIYQQINDYLINHIQSDSRLLKLPDELLLKILLYLSRKDIVCVNAVCLRLQRICKDGNIKHNIIPPLRNYLAKPTVKKFIGHQGSIKHLAVLSKRRFASSSEDNTIRIWDSKTGHCLNIIKIDSLKLIGIETLRSNQIITHHFETKSTLTLWDTDTGKQLQTIQINGMICYVVLSNNTIIIADSGNINIKNRHKSLRSIFLRNTSPAQQSTINRNKTAFFRIWNLHTGECLAKIKTNYNIISFLKNLPNDHLVGIGQVFEKKQDNNKQNLSYSTDICVWNSFTGECLQFYQIRGMFNTEITGVLPTPDEKVLVGHSALELWDPKKNQSISKIYSPRAKYFRYMSNGHLVFTEGKSRQMKIWSIDKKETLYLVEGHEGAISCIEILPNGYILSGSKDKSIRIWCSKTGKCLKKFNLHKNNVNGIIILPNGNFFSHSDDKTIAIWRFPIANRSIEILNSLGLSYYNNNCHWNPTVQNGLIDPLKKQRHDNQINLHGRELGYPSMFLLSKGLISNKSIHKLNLSHCSITDSSICKLADAIISNTTLKYLNLQSNHFSNSGVLALATMLTKNTTLKYLDIRKNTLKNVSYIELAKALIKNSFVKLNVDIKRTPHEQFLKTLILLRKKMLAQQKSLSTIAKQAIKHDDLKLLIGFISYLEFDPLQTDLNGNTLLHYAVIYNHLKIAEYLVTQGLDVTEKNNVGLSPIDLSMSNECPNNQMVKLLVSTCSETQSPRWLMKAITDIQQQKRKIIDLSSGNFTKKHVTDQNTVQISKSLANNSSVTHLNLAGNDIGERGAQAFVNLLNHNATLLAINLDNNRHIRSKTHSIIQSALFRNRWLQHQLQKLVIVLLNQLRVFTHIEITHSEPNMTAVFLKQGLLVHITSFLDEEKLLTLKQIKSLYYFAASKDTLGADKNEFLEKTNTNKLKLFKNNTQTIFGRQTLPLSKLTIKIEAVKFSLSTKIKQQLHKSLTC